MKTTNLVSTRFHHFSREIFFSDETLKPCKMCAQFSKLLTTAAASGYYIFIFSLTQSSF